MKEFNITSDGRYLQMLGKIVDLRTNASIDIESPNPTFVCEMYKNQFLIAHRDNIFESTNLFKKMKELLYPMMGQNSSHILEYEVRYGGKLIFESEDKLRTEQLITESWEFVKSKIYEQTIVIEGYYEDFVSGAKNMASSVGTVIKSAASSLLTKGLPWFFKTLENFLISPRGIGLDVALSAIGVGKIATGILWGSILLWKVYLLATGASDASSLFTYLDLAVCMLGIGFSGAAKGLRVTLKSAGANIAKLGAKILQPIFGVIGKGVGGLMRGMAKPLEWVASIFGPKASTLISTFKGRISRIFTQMNTAITKAAGNQAPSFTSTIKKGISQDILNPAAAALAGKGPVSIGSAALKGAKFGAAFYGGEKLLQKGMEKYGNEISQGINSVKGALGFETDATGEKINVDNAEYDFETSL